jgi:hypothetical protein
MDMEENKKRFLDKIIEWLVIDTVIDYKNRTWFPTFLDMGDYLATLRPLDISNLSLYPIIRFYDYCRKIYDLSVEEIEYLWSKYTIIIIDKFNNEKPINESEDRRKKFLDKVVDFLVKDTKVDYDKRTLFFPFTYKRSLRQGTNNLTPFHKLLFDSYIPIDGFMEYIKELYDITSIEDITHVWETYKVIMNKIVFGDNTTPLYFNESEKGSINEDSRQDLIDKVDERVKKYLDKVVDFIIKETVIDYGIDKFNPVIKDEVLWYPPFSERSYSHRQSMYNTGANYDFNNYCQEVFSIYDEGEQLYVWERYRKLLGFKMRNMMINESEDRKQNYLNKIIDWLVDDTEVGGLWFEPPYKTGLIYAENSITLSSLYKQTFGLLKYVTDVESVKFAIQKNYFKKFCEEQYGLTEDETEYVWKGFMKDLYESEKYNSLNESEDKKQKYLDKILKWFVDDTIIRYETGIIYYPFSSIGPTGKRLPSFFDNIINKLSMNFPSDIHIYCRDTYGLNPDETKYIWDKYKKIIRDRYDKESMMYHRDEPINESDDKKQVYLDRVVDWLFKDTEVGNSWFNPPYYYPGSSAGRTGFKSVYEHTFGLSTNNTYSGLDSQLIYFDSYCKNNYGLTGEETKIVWFEYMKKLKESYDWRF